MVIVTNSTYTTPTVVKQFEISSGSSTSLEVLEYLKEGSNTIKIVVLGETSSKVATLTYTVTYAEKEEEEVVYTDFLERSDLAGTYYSTVQAAFDAVVADYPDGLTQDVTISCIADNVTTSRTTNVYIAEISEWNKDTLYTLTLDGNNQLTMDCKSLGGIYLSFVDNFHCKNVSFVDVANYIGTYSPEEVSAIRFDGNVESYSRNLLVENCKINGQYDTSEKFGYYGVDCKYAENIYVCNTSFTSMYVIPLKFTDCKIVSLIKNYVDASLSYGIIGHPALCTFTTGNILIAEDNTFTGTTGEYAFYIKNVDYMYFRRNSFHDIGGEAIRFSSSGVVKEFVLESNLFYNILSAPSVTWAFNYIVFECDVEYVNINGNTVHANGSQWQQWFLRAGDISVDTMNFYNNIISSGLSSSKPFYSIQMGTVSTLNSGYNLYRLALKDSDTDTASMNIFNASGLSNTNSLTSLQSQGLETGSWLISNSENIFQSESGSSAYKLLSSLASTYAADADHLPSIDIEYLEAAASGNNIGCYNLAGTAIDETVDESGYEGYDVDREKSFSSEALYDTYAECILLLMHNTRNRSRIVRFKAVGSQHSVLMLGRYGIIQPYPVLDDNGEYVEDEYYDINIE
ncbi:MAG: hypothetical protein Q4D56_05755 [Bacteroides sp.]|nr:hypothetical protein [Bacteroides sp.]